MTLMSDKAFGRAPIPTLESPGSASIRPVLARDADATYWMSRYVERAEHVARLLRISSDALIDVGDLSDSLVQSHWLSVLQIMNAADQLPSADESLPRRIAEYMTFDQKNPNSLISCLTRARENARGIREVISSEMWEHLNLLYWSIRSEDAPAAFQESPDQLYQQIINGSMLFQGLTDQTLVHGQRWFFTQLGKDFERITVTCRTLKCKHEILRAAEPEIDTPMANIYWTTVLRSCGAIEAYRRMHLGEFDPVHVTGFLLLEERFPRSVRYCVRQAHRSIRAIREAVRPRSVNPTERVLGRLSAQLDYAEPSEVFAKGLPAYLDQILDDIAQAAIGVQRSFFLH